MSAAVKDGEVRAGCVPPIPGSASEFWGLCTKQKDFCVLLFYGITEGGILASNMPYHNIKPLVQVSGLLL